MIKQCTFSTSCKFKSKIVHRTWTLLWTTCVPVPVIKVSRNLWSNKVMYIESYLCVIQFRFLVRFSLSHVSMPKINFQFESHRNLHAIWYANQKFFSFSRFLQATLQTPLRRRLKFISMIFFLILFSFMYVFILFLFCTVKDYYHLTIVFLRRIYLFTVNRFNQLIRFTLHIYFS